MAAAAVLVAMRTMVHVARSVNNYREGLENAYDFIANVEQ